VFDDVNPNSDRDLERFLLFDREKAREIGRFVMKNFGSFGDVAVHCDAGISRSCAVGAALGDYFNLEYDREILARSERGINRFVYDLLMEELERMCLPTKVTKSP
jgi:predicted protein tyrosine phosphatase